MMPFFKRISFVFILVILVTGPCITRGQDNPNLQCSDIRNGTFNYFDQRTGESEIFIRKGDVQREIIPKRKETIFWDVAWLNDCTYTLKYQSGAENRPATEQKLLNKHIVVTVIQQVTENYVTLRSSLDKVSNPAVLNDTMWIKQRVSDKNVKVTNPRADSIAASKKKIIDSTEASYATIYVYRPKKFLGFDISYNLMINGEKAFVITNGCKYQLKIHKPGSFILTAKMAGPDQTITIDAKPGGVYYVKCTITLGMTNKEIMLMDNKEGATEYNNAD